MYTYMTRRGILNVCTLHTAYLHVCNLIYLSIQPQYVAICKTSLTVNPLSHCKLSASMAFISIHSLYSHENICPPCKYYCPRTEICGKILSHPCIIFVCQPAGSLSPSHSPMTNYCCKVLSLGNFFCTCTYIRQKLL